MVALERDKGRRRLGNHQMVGRGRDVGTAEPIGQGDDPEGKGDCTKNVRAPAPVGSACQPQPDDLVEPPPISKTMA